MGEGGRPVKRVPKSQPEPNCLRSYREEEPVATWDQFKDEAQTCYGGANGVLETLEKDQGGLCAYCETKINALDRQVAHFHPKDDSTPARNWHLDWENLWLACKGGTNPTLQGDKARYLEPIKDNRSCDEAKENNIVDDVVLHPRAIPAFPRVFKFHTSADCVEMRVDVEGCEAAGINADRASKTLEVFNLNCRRLTAARMAIFAEIEHGVKRISSLPDRDEKLRLYTQARLAKSGNDWPAYFTMIRWRFGRFAEDYLQSIQYQG